MGYTYDSRKSEPGEPDLRMVHPKRHQVIFAELKTEKGRLSKARWNKSKTRLLPGQDEWGEALQSCLGVQYYLWRPSDWPCIEEILAQPLLEAKVGQTHTSVLSGGK